jgi:hypothetical protein
MKAGPVPDLFGIAPALLQIAAPLQAHQIYL